MHLRTRGAQPITKIAVRILIEIDAVSDAAIDREIARARGSNISMAGRRPTKQILRAKIVASLAKARTKTHDLVDFMLGRPLRVKVATAGRPIELKRLGGIESAVRTNAAAKSADGVSLACTRRRPVWGYTCSATPFRVLSNLKIRQFGLLLVTGLLFARCLHTGWFSTARNMGDRCERQSRFRVENPTLKFRKNYMSALIAGSTDVTVRWRSFVVLGRRRWSSVNSERIVGIARARNQRHQYYRQR